MILTLLRISRAFIFNGNRNEFKELLWILDEDSRLMSKKSENFSTCHPKKIAMLFWITFVISRCMTDESHHFDTSAAHVPDYLIILQ